MSVRFLHQAYGAAALMVVGLLFGSTAVSAPQPATLQTSDQMQRLITDVAREFIPHNYENEKHWGKTKDVVRGLYVKREGWQVKTHRTTKSVNHGTWTKYRIELLDPEQQFQVRLEHIRRLANNRLAFDIQCDARVRIFGRLAEWRQGVQLISLSAEADATVELTMQCDLATRFDSSTIPPALVFDPVVRHADLKIDDFRMRHISQLNGPLVKTLSASVREVLEDEIAHRRDKIVSQINRQIDKRRDKLRLSFGDLFAPHTPANHEKSAAQQATTTK